MFLGHSHEAAVSRLGRQEVPIFLLEPLRAKVSLQKHRRAPVSLREPSAWRQATVSLQEHPEFLRLLADKRFRQELKAKPVEVLARFGVRLASREVPAGSVELPSPPAKIDLAWTALF